MGFKTLTLFTKCRKNDRFHSESSYEHGQQQLLQPERITEPKILEILKEHTYLLGIFKM